MQKRYIFLIVFLFIALAALLMLYFYLPTEEEKSPQSIQEKNIEVRINTDGTSQEKIIWKVGIPRRFAYFSPGEWGISIPVTAYDIKVKDSEQELEYRLEDAEQEKYKGLFFENPENINYGENYFFEITYSVNKNPVTYEPNHFYQRTFTRFDTDNAFSLKLILPENSEIISLSKTPDNTDNQILEYRLEQGGTATIALDFTIPGQQPPQLKQISSRHYQAILPEKYSEEYQETLNKADQAVEFIEELYGFSPENKWLVELTNQNQGFEEDVEGFYLGEGRINLKITNLRKTEKEILYILLHETIHGFDYEIFGDEVPNFWWKEGNAQYTSYKALESLGYDTENLKRQNLEIIEFCKENEKEFITLWSPNELIQAGPPEINCQGEITNQLSLGYAQSYFIVSNLAEQYPYLFRSFYATAKQEQLNFSSEHYDLNNQMSYLLSKALNTDITSQLREYGLNVEPLEEISPITGMPIFEEGEEPTVFAYIVLAIIILIIIVIIIKRRKKKPN